MSSKKSPKKESVGEELADLRKLNKEYQESFNKQIQELNENAKRLLK